MTIINTQYIKQDRLGRITLEYLAQVKNIFVDFWNQCLDFFSSYKWRELLFDLKLISLILSLIFFALICFLIFKTHENTRIQRVVNTNKGSENKISDKRIIKKWNKIEKKLDTDSVDNYKLAVLEADDLMERVLKTLGTINIAKISNMNEIENARAIKQKIIENKKFKINQEQARKILSAYQKALQEIGII